MEIDWTYDGCDQMDERTIERWWEEIQTRLEAKLAELPVEPAGLRLAISHDSESDEWLVQAALHLPIRTLVVESTSENVKDALEQTIRGLADQINLESDQKGVFTADESPRRSRLEAILPFLERNRAEERSGIFFTFLQPLMRTLDAHVRQELDILELEGAIPGEEIEPDDVLDEVMVRAWDPFPDRPASVSLFLWLVQLMESVLDEYSQGTTHASLEEDRPVALPEQNDQTSRDSWTEHAGYPETIELGDLLAVRPGIDSWDRLDIETKQTGLAKLLSILPRIQRQALVLNMAEGFELTEIADFQDRSKAEVTADIESAQQTLWKEFEKHK